MTDPSRLEAAEAGLHHEQEELAHGRAPHPHHGTPDADHVVAEDALSPLEPVVLATPPSRGALLAGAVAALLTLAAVVAFAVKISGA